MSSDVSLEDVPRPSASVLLLRDGAQGVEVLMQRRSERARVHGGLYVFPGGKLEASDSAAAWTDGLDLDANALRQRLAEPDTDALTAQGLHVAALRETFEEAGVLLVTPSVAGAQLPPQAVVAAQLAQGLRDGQTWPHVMAQAGLRWHTQALQPWSRWITPQHKLAKNARFDARFFLARLPAGQQVEQDDHEAVESVWMTPRLALQRLVEQEIRLLPPQIMSLIELMTYGDTEALWRAAADRRPPVIQPVHFDVDGGIGVCYPGDPVHPESEQVLPGPTRFRMTATGFEPFGGWDGWLDSLG